MATIFFHFLSVLLIIKRENRRVSVKCPGDSITRNVVDGWDRIPKQYGITKTDPKGQDVFSTILRLLGLFLRLSSLETVLEYGL